MSELNYKHWPDAEHRFFIYDPAGFEFRYYKTAEERNDASDDVIRLHLDDGWSEDVDQVIAGEITHHTIMRAVEVAPKREDYNSDEEYDDAASEFGCSDCDYKCNYELAPLDDPGEEPPILNKTGGAA